MLDRFGVPPQTDWMWWGMEPQVADKLKALPIQDAMGRWRILISDIEELEEQMPKSEAKPAPAETEVVQPEQPPEWPSNGQSEAKPQPEAVGMPVFEHLGHTPDGRPIVAVSEQKLRQLLSGYSDTLIGLLPHA